MELRRCKGNLNQREERSNGAIEDDSPERVPLVCVPLVPPEPCQRLRLRLEYVGLQKIQPGRQQQEVAGEVIYGLRLVQDAGL